MKESKRHEVRQKKKCKVWIDQLSEIVYNFSQSKTKMAKSPSWKREKYKNYFIERHWGQLILEIMFLQLLIIKIFKNKNDLALFIFIIKF